MTDQTAVHGCPHGKSTRWIPLALALFVSTSLLGCAAFLDYLNDPEVARMEQELDEARKSGDQGRIEQAVSDYNKALHDAWDRFRDEYRGGMTSIDPPTLKIESGAPVVGPDSVVKWEGIARGPAGKVTFVTIADSKDNAFYERPPNADQTYTIPVPEDGKLFVTTHWTESLATRQELSDPALAGKNVVIRWNEETKQYTMSEAGKKQIALPTPIIAETAKRDSVGIPLSVQDLSSPPPTQTAGTAGDTESVLRFKEETIVVGSFPPPTQEQVEAAHQKDIQERHESQLLKSKLGNLLIGIGQTNLSGVAPDFLNRGRDFAGGSGLPYSDTSDDTALSLFLGYQEHLGDFAPDLELYVRGGITYLLDNLRRTFQVASPGGGLRLTGQPGVGDRFVGEQTLDAWNLGVEVMLLKQFTDALYGGVNLGFTYWLLDSDETLQLFAGETLIGEDVVEEDLDDLAFDFSAHFGYRIAAGMIVEAIWKRSFDLAGGDADFFGLALLFETRSLSDLLRRAQVRLE